MPDQNNIERLFDKVDTMIASINCTNNSVSILSTKIDEFSYRLRRLEERDEKNLEKQEKLEVLAAKVEGLASQGVTQVSDLTKRVDLVEDDITKIKTNWGWLTAIISVVGGLIGWVVSTGLGFWVHH